MQGYRDYAPAVDKSLDLIAGKREMNTEELTKTDLQTDIETDNETSIDKTMLSS